MIVNRTIWLVGKEKYPIETRTFCLKDGLEQGEISRNTGIRNIKDP